MGDMKNRCDWAGSDPLYIAYHDNEWGVVCHDDRRLFEALVLDGFQAGLSWLTILKKREHFRQAFDNFDARRIAAYGPERIEALMQNRGIVRNRLKIEATISNAACYLDIQQSFGSFSAYLWRFVDDRPIRNHWRQVSQIPAFSAEAQAMSNDLKKRGFRFAGPTICYAFMQAVGMVNDHLTSCFRYHEV